RDRQDDARWVLRVVKDRLLRHPQLSGGVVVESGIQVAIETWEVAGGDVDADAMAAAEDVAGDLQVDGQRIDLARLHELRLLPGLHAVVTAQAGHRSLGIVCEAIGRSVLWRFGEEPAVAIQGVGAAAAVQVPRDELGAW